MSLLFFLTGMDEMRPAVQYGDLDDGKGRYCHNHANHTLDLTADDQSPHDE